MVENGTLITLIIGFTRTSLKKSVASAESAYYFILAEQLQDSNDSRATRFVRAVYSDGIPANNRIHAE